MDGCTILVASGRYVNPLDLRADDVSIEDIAHALGNQCRYSGHTREFYSVGEHCVRLATVLVDAHYTRDACLWGLLHDAAEAYLVDLPRPLKLDPVFGAFYRQAEERALRAVIEHFGLTPVEPEAVKMLDLRMLATERRDLMPPGGDWAVLDGVVLLPGAIEPWSPEDARETFLSMYDEILGVAPGPARSGVSRRV